MLKGHPCPICDIEREYKTPQGIKVGKNKPCRVCANSLSRGGVGRSNLCIDCKTSNREYNSLCKPCHNNRSKKYYREKGRWSKYGLKGPIEMKECSMCHSEKDLVIDHCHNSGKVRGVLCRNCNMAIGLMKDSEDTLQNAINYLRSFNGTE